MHPQHPPLSGVCLGLKSFPTSGSTDHLTSRRARLHHPTDAWRAALPSSATAFNRGCLGTEVPTAMAHALGTATAELPDEGCVRLPSDTGGSKSSGRGEDLGMGPREPWASLGLSAHWVGHPGLLLYSTTNAGCILTLEAIGAMVDHNCLQVAFLVEQVQGTRWAYGRAWALAR